MATRTAARQPAFRDYASDKRKFEDLSAEQQSRVERSFTQPEIDSAMIDDVVNARSNDERDRAAAKIGLMVAAAWVEHRNAEVEQIANEEPERWDGLS